MLPEPQGRVAFGTKAETLARLAPLITTGTVPALLWFTVARWRRTRHAVLAEIASRCGSTDLAVRSSARGEDGADTSGAGRFRSRLVVAPAAVGAAVDDVIASYAGDPEDQVLVQPMVRDVAVAGVAATHGLEDGAPYWVVSYDDRSGTTDGVTGGTGDTTTVAIAHAAPVDELASPRVRRWLAVLHEVAALCGHEPLEIELAEDHAGTLWLLQARRIATVRHWTPGIGPRALAALARIAAEVAARSHRQPGIAGARTILGVMPDWNPAEIVGTTPTPLAASLYARLVTDRAWRIARARMGYRPLPDRPLVTTMAGRPYVDVRLSCNSFLPRDTTPAVAERLVDAWLDRLETYPELHDQVEFAIVPTVVDFTFDATFRERYGDLLGAGLPAYRESLRRLTGGLLARGPHGTLAAALADVARLARRQRVRATAPADEGERTAFAVVLTTLDECERLGTVPFATIARHAFAAEALVRSAVARGALAPERLDAFKASLVLVTGALLDDLRTVAAGGLTPEQFLARYGHLRPGTYDIRSRRYDQRPHLFDGPVAIPAAPRTPFMPTPEETRTLDALLAEAGLPTDAGGLFDYAATAIAGRERAKLVFSRSLSDALEMLARWGARLGLTRDQLAYVPLAGMRLAAECGAPRTVARRLALLAEEGRAGTAFLRTLRLGHLVRGVGDVQVVSSQHGTPSFVGAACVEGRTVVLDGGDGLGGDDADLHGAIVCVANADPGFDWIFARGIAGLVTTYGGSHSHMAIRCAELRVPAALGCGELAFARLARSRRIELDGAAHVVRPIA